MKKLLWHLDVLVFWNWINWHKSFTAACICEKLNSVALHAKNTECTVQYGLAADSGFWVTLSLYYEI